MPSPFAALENELSDAVDGTFGELFEMQPMRAATPNSPGEPDPDRIAIAFQAVIDDRSPGAASFARLNVASSGRGGGGAELSATNPIIFMDERRLQGQRPQRRDRFKRLDTGDVYEAIDVHKDGMGRYRVALNRVRRDT